MHEIATHFVYLTFSVIFLSVSVHPCHFHFVRHFPVCKFPPLSLCSSSSCQLISTPVTLSVIFLSCNFSQPASELVPVLKELNNLSGLWMLSSTILRGIYHADPYEAFTRKHRCSIIPTNLEPDCHVSDS